MNSAPPLTIYHSLRQEGIRHLEQLAGSRWTDFNEHDPGITILEQYCYALTELAYRCDFPLPDLLQRQGREPYASLFSPATILTTHPVTLTDLRKLIVDVRGVKNAWIEVADGELSSIFYNAEGNSPLQDHHENLIQISGDEATQRVALQGLYRVMIEISDVLSVNTSEVVRNVAKRLHAYRPLCMDFESITVMPQQEIQVRTSIEIAPGANPESLYAAIVQKIANHISPSIRFYTLRESLDKGLRIDEIFDGPPLVQGFIDTVELSNATRKTALRVSDLIREIMDVAGVVMVTHLSLRGGNQWESWWLDLAKGQSPIFDIGNSIIKLERQQIEVSVDHVTAEKLRLQLQDKQAYRPALPEELDVVPPRTRDRKIGHYYSAQHHFPDVYGLGARGLPPQASAERQAQLRQLQAYLLFFDQLLANQFSQLAHVGDLLGFDNDDLQTYFIGDLNDPSLNLDAVWNDADSDSRQARLNGLVESSALPEGVNQFSRKNRFLDHLLARFGDQFSNHAEFRSDLGDDSANREQQAALDKLNWLRNYPQLSGRRGSGFDTGLSADNCSGIEQRLRIKLGLDPSRSEEHFYLIEHLLLRPIDADRPEDDLPLMANVRNSDPYSLQISLIFPAWLPRFQAGNSYRRFVEQTVREEIPAHLLVYVLWLDQTTMTDFAQTYQEWLDSQALFRAAGEQNSLNPSLDKNDVLLLSLKLRSARDRLIDWLAIAQTYPLADLPVSYTKVVAWGELGNITIIASQKNVLYRLFDKEGNEVNSQYGDGNRLTLKTAEITKDIGFTIKAEKHHRNAAAGIDTLLSITLFHSLSLTIKVGLNTGLATSLMDGEEIDKADIHLAATRLVDFGASVGAKVFHSQAGVDYRLVTVSSDQAHADFIVKDLETGVAIGVKYLSANSVRGNNDDIDLLAEAMHEDTDIRVLAVKTFAAADHQQDQNALLDTVLPLKVRANPALEVTVEQSLLDYQTGTQIVIKDAQASADYQLYSRNIADSEFIRDKAIPGLSVPGMDALWVSNPANPSPNIQGLGKAVAGSGQALSLAIDKLMEDTLFVVQAHKTHRLTRTQSTTESSLQLSQASAVLVRPGADSDFSLRFKSAQMDSALGLQKGMIYQVLNGQAGVYYHFRLATADQELGLPVYFHKDGKGIDAIGVEIDFAIGDGLPNPPEWDCPLDLAADSKLSVRAVKAQTGLELVYEISVAALLANT